MGYIHKKNHRVLNKDLKKELFGLKLNINSSPRNVCLKNKHRTQQKVNYQIVIEKLLINYKNDLVIEPGMKINFNEYDSPEKIAEYINKCF